MFQNLLLSLTQTPPAGTLFFAGCSTGGRMQKGKIHNGKGCPVSKGKFLLKLEPKARVYRALTTSNSLPEIFYQERNTYVPARCHTHESAGKSAYPQNSPSPPARKWEAVRGARTSCVAPSHVVKATHGAQCRRQARRDRFWFP